jgi:hypothetical protein
MSPAAPNRDGPTFRGSCLTRSWVAGNLAVPAPAGDAVKQVGDATCMKPQSNAPVKRELRCHMNIMGSAPQLSVAVCLPYPVLEPHSCVPIKCNLCTLLNAG